MSEQRAPRLEVSPLLLEHSRDTSMLEDFGRSLAYTAVQSPITAILQPIDRTFGTELAAHPFIAPPDEAKFNTGKFWAQQTGAAVGMLGTFWLVGKGVRGFTRCGMTETQIAQTMSNRGILGLTMKEAALTGFFHDSILKPSDPRDTRSLLSSRLASGATGALTMPTLTAASIGLRHAGRELVATRPATASLLQNEVLGGFVSGTGAGFVAAQSHSILKDGHFASLQETGKSMYTMGVVGAGFGGYHRWSEGPHRSSNSNGERAPAEQIRQSVVVDQAVLTEPIRPLAEPVVRQQTQQVAPEALRPQPETQLARPLEIARPEPVRDSIPFREHVSIREAQQQIESVNQTQLELPRLRDGADPSKFATPEDFLSQGIEHVAEPAISYKFKGVSTEVVVTAEYARQLEPVRRLREQYGDDPYKIPEAALREAGITREFASRALPEDMVGILEGQPDMGRTGRLVLSGRANPEDAYHRLTDPGFTSAATARGDNMTLYQIPRDLFLREHVMHEWSHLVYYGSGQHAKLFEAAAAMEQGGYQTRDYAGTNVRENWAVNLSENFLSPELEVARSFFERAPLRTMAMADAMRSTLQNAPTKSPLHDFYLQRVAEAETIARPLATKLLAERIAAGQASRETLAMLLRYAEPSQLRDVKLPSSINLEGQVVTDADIARLSNHFDVKDLNLNYTLVSPNIGKLLKNMRSLETLSLRGTQINNSSMRDLGSLPNLRQLDIRNTPISDGGFSQLSWAPQLQRVQIAGTNVSVGAIGSLTQRKPAIQIER